MEAQNTKALSLIHIIIGAFVLQLFFVQSLWGHASEVGQFLGRYSTRYAIILLFSLGIQAGWIIVFFGRERIRNWVQRIPNPMIYGLLLFIAASTIPVLLQPIEHHVRYYYLATIWSIMTFFIFLLPDKPVNLWWFYSLLLLFFLITIPTNILTILTLRGFSPDEAQWADRASSLFFHEGIYSQNWREQPYLISPGLGWFNAVYGWILSNIAFHPFVSRFWNMTSDVVTYIAIYLLANRLYGRRVALTGVIFAVFHRAYWEAFEYRPDHWVGGPALFTLLFAIVGFQTRHRIRYLWHFAAGLGATLLIQIHPIGIVYILSLTFFYSGFFIRNAWLKHLDQKTIATVSVFVAGAALGTAIHYLFNVQVVGGLENFLQLLFVEAPPRERPFYQYIIRWPEVWGRFLIVCGIGFLLWRRNSSDRLFLALFGGVFIASFFFDSQGYSVPYWGLYIIIISVLLVNGFQSPGIAIGKNRRSVWIIGAMVFMLLVWSFAVRTRWTSISYFLQTGRPQEHELIRLTDEVKTYIRPDDTIVSGTELVWIFHGPDLDVVGFEAESPRVSRYEWTEPIEFWEIVQPTAIIDIERRIRIPAGLREYMERENFIICVQYTQLNRQVTLYRQTCTEPAPDPSES